MAYGGPQLKRAQVTVWANSLETTNATTKYLVMEFTEGRRIRFEIVNPKPGTQPEVAQQVALSECLGNCVDW